VETLIIQKRDASQQRLALTPLKCRHSFYQHVDIQILRIPGCEALDNTLGVILVLSQLSISSMITQIIIQLSQQVFMDMKSINYKITSKVNQM